MPKGKNKGKNKGKKGGQHGPPKGECEFTQEELAGSRPPPWAKGKSIGLWHRARSIKRLLSGKMGPEGVEKAKIIMSREEKRKAKQEEISVQPQPISVPPEKLAEVNIL